MKVYIDSEYKCHIENDGTMREFDVSAFDGKSKLFIEGFRYVPVGETWAREDGEEFRGEMTSAWKPYDQLEQVQESYDEAADNMLSDIETAYTEGVNSI